VLLLWPDEKKVDSRAFQSQTCLSSAPRSVASAWRSARKQVRPDYLKPRKKGLKAAARQLICSAEETSQVRPSRKSRRCVIAALLIFGNSGERNYRQKRATGQGKCGGSDMTVPKWRESVPNN
jgi:hypothetical protein